MGSNMPRCKPGQLALVVNPKNPENLGRVVLVVEDWAGRQFHDSTEWGAFDPDIQVWLVEFLGEPGYTRTRERRPRVGRHISGPCWDSSLIPLPDQDDVTAFDASVEEKPKSKAERS